MSEWQFFNKAAPEGTREAALHICLNYNELRMRLAQHMVQHRCKADNLSIRVSPDATEQEYQQLRSAGYWVESP